VARVVRCLRPSGSDGPRTTRRGSADRRLDRRANHDCRHKSGGLVSTPESLSSLNSSRAIQRSWRWADILSLAGPYLGLLLVIVLFSLLIGLTGGRAESFLSLSNLKLVAVQAAIPAAVALGMTVIMISGGIDLSVGYVVSLATVTMMLTYRLAVEQTWRPYLESALGLHLPYLEFLALTASLWAIVVGLGTGGLFGWTKRMLLMRLR